MRLNNNNCWRKEIISCWTLCRTNWQSIPHKISSIADPLKFIQIHSSCFSPENADSRHWEKESLRITKFLLALWKYLYYNQIRNGNPYHKTEPSKNSDSFWPSVFCGLVAIRTAGSNAERQLSLPYWLSERLNIFISWLLHNHVRAAQQLVKNNQ